MLLMESIIPLKTTVVIIFSFHLSGYRDSLVEVVYQQRKTECDLK